MKIFLSVLCFILITSTAFASISEDIENISLITKALPKSNAFKDIKSNLSIQSRSEYYLIKFNNLNNECMQIRTWVLEGVSQSDDQINITKNVEFEEPISCK